MKQKIYISGKIGNLPDGNRPKFEEAEKFLRAQGYIPINPHNLHPANTQHYTCADFMREDIVALMDCQVIAVLDDWKTSPGAMVEVKLALTLGMKLICAHTLQVLEADKDEPIDDVNTKQILREVKREIDMRKAVYRGLVMSGKLTKEESSHRIKVMEKILQDYRDLKFIGTAVHQEIHAQTQGTLFND
jgi:hypothetical protein